VGGPAPIDGRCSGRQWPVAGGGERAARPAREQRRPGSPTCGALTTVIGGGVNPV
jgi:hypothetical protein